MLRCQHCGRVIRGQAAGLKTHIREQHPEHAGVAPETSNQRREQLSPWKLGGLTAFELAKRVWNSMNNDDVFGRSAQLAYYFFFSLFPALIFLSSILGLFAGPGTKLHGMLLQYIGTALPEAAFQMVQRVFDQTTKASGGGKITFGLLVTLWSASSAMAAVQDTLNVVYDAREKRPIWKARGIALVLTIVCSALLIQALSVILYGNVLADFIGSHIGLSMAITWTWKIVQWPIALFFLAMIFSVTYYFGPDVEQRRWEWLTPGALVGMTTWIIASVALRVYMHYFDSYSATYGSLGAVIILLMWFYVTGMMLLLGAEVNAEIENAATQSGDPEAKHKGHKVPQQDERPAAYGSFS
jgi:membrane protein